MKKIIWVLCIGLFTLVACNDDDDTVILSSDEEEEQTNEEIAPADQDEDVPSEVTMAADSFLSSFVHEEFDAAAENLSAEVSAELGSTELQQLWQQLKEQYGDFIDYEYQQSQQVNGFYVQSYAGLFSGEEITFEVTVDQADQIAGFYLK
ncbi:DUF3887 domain-containing protein [Gracilibacillus timonensis]|uniref:DUF3887 domain-containing protein n=1 Tax=Gracilibacillus timonensis TaxID=1816696 RepID=UPI00082575A2|nr:DUF3887 domain-containing protein [Gracilibacillus timonensis]